MEISAQQFEWLFNLWSEVSINQRYKKGLSSKTVASKLMCCSLNPSKNVDVFRNYLLDEGILKFNSEGLIVIDDKRLLSLLRSNKTYMVVKAYISDCDSTIFVE